MSQLSSSSNPSPWPMSFGMDAGAETAGQVISEPHRYGINDGQDLLGQRHHTNSSTSTSGRSTPHKPTPSPLQVSETSSMVSGDAVYNTSRSPKSPTVKRVGSDSQPSPLSPRFHQSSNFDQPRSSRTRPDQRPAVEATTSTNGDMSLEELGAFSKATASPTKSQSYSQLRNVSSPLPQAKPLGNSSPPSPSSTVPPPLTGSALRPEARSMPRTSSIDSAISGISLTALSSHRPSQDAQNSGTPDIANLISTVGSAEAVIQHLLREKQSAAAQNAQLWKLVDKQRSLVLGLNQDLERALKDKEKYRRKLREHLERVPPVPSAAAQFPVLQSRADSGSPAPSEASTDLPIQRQSEDHSGLVESHEDDVVSVPKIDSSKEDEKAPPSINPAGVLEAENWVKSKVPTSGTKHSHRSTSSSDVGVLGPTRPAPPIMPIQTRGLETLNRNAQPESPSQCSETTRPGMSPTTSFTAKRAQPFSAKPFNGPALSLTESTPTGTDNERMTPPRKAPPAPLDLGQPKREEPDQPQFGPDDHSSSDYDDTATGLEELAFERGRKKTREDDDREREAALLKEKQDRSRSKKAKGSKSRTGSAKAIPKDTANTPEPQPTPIPPNFKALSPGSAPAGASMFLSPPASLASVLSPSETRNDSGPAAERIISMKPMSPGLPLSPRPNHRPINPPTPRMPREGAGPALASPPLSPRPGFVGLPLSPRAPRQPIPLPPHTPMSIASPLPPNGGADSTGFMRDPVSPTKKPMTSHRLDNHTADVSQSKGIYKGFVSDAYPNLLLPPNALPSILVKVVSSRLKPSRHSLVLKGSDEEPVFTLGVSARSNRQGLWQVEKPILSLQHLDQQLRQCCVLNVKLPERSLFSGHAPAKIDARRLALEAYFEALLDTPMDEKAALKICHYLSTHASEPAGEEPNSAAVAPHSGSPVTQGLEGKLAKEGYLTKRGKNFGGWKARFFVLNDPTLRYYETPGGSLLGTIKIQHAQIGKQTQRQSSQSPSRTGEDGDGQYRHAFLIREPKRKDSSSYVDHVLCAESDGERDAWVSALLCYVDVPGADGKPKPPPSSHEATSSRSSAPSKKNSLRRDAASVDSPASETFDTLQALPYESTRQAEAPHVRITPDPRPNESPSPSPTTSGSQPSVRTQSAQSAQPKTISAPSNGAKISDAGAWGNKPMATPIGAPKEPKKRSIWGFRDKSSADIGAHHSNDSNLSLPQQQYQEQITNVKAAFGVPLAEAVEYCAPRGVEVCLPAVVYRCIEYLEARHAASEEGIFRMSGSNVVIKGLKSRFNAEGDIDLLSADEQLFDVHAVASLLKLYLRELPQPVLTRELHLQFISVLGE